MPRFTSPVSTITAAALPACSPMQSCNHLQPSLVKLPGLAQVEHTVTEEITGVDLVQAQIRIAGGASLADVGLASQVCTIACAQDSAHHVPISPIGTRLCFMRRLTTRKTSCANGRACMGMSLPPQGVISCCCTPCTAWEP